MIPETPPEGMLALACMIPEGLIPGPACICISSWAIAARAAASPDEPVFAYCGGPESGSPKGPHNPLIELGFTGPQRPWHGPAIMLAPGLFASVETQPLKVIVSTSQAPVVRFMRSPSEASAAAGAGSRKPLFRYRLPGVILD
jgi:hypothetical protein